MPTTKELFDQGVRFHQLGELVQAESLYRQILQIDPAYADAYHHLGMLAQQTGHCEAARALIGQAIALVPGAGVFHNNLGLVHKLQDQWGEAEECFRQALRLDPNHAEAHNNLGSILIKEGLFAEAAASFREALRINPQYADAHYNLGLALQDQGQFAEAMESYRQAIRLNPNHGEAYLVLGLAYLENRQLGKSGDCFTQMLRLERLQPISTRSLLAEAGRCFQQMIRLNPNHAHAHYLLGKVFYDQGRPTEAIPCYRQALRVNPNYADAYINLGLALVEENQLAESIECFQQALRINPKNVLALGNIGNVLRSQGFLDESISCYRQALEIEPNHITAHSNLIFTLYFCPGQTPESLFREHQRWQQRHAEPLATFIQPHDNDKSPERRLRIGYLSPDFRIHPIGRFMAPLLEAHDHAEHEIYCYSSLTHVDEWTNQCKKHADVWRDVHGWSDAEVANSIRRDRIDILVDLTMHMANSRLLVFARKPAPVQVTYLAYPGTTGLSTMDYRLTDTFLDPPGPNQSFYTEQSIYLPDSYWCYKEVSADLALTPPPVLTNGFITFGCLNNFCKVTAPTLETWSRILQAVPDSRLLLCTPQGSHRNRVTDFLTQRNVAGERVLFVDIMKTREYFRTYERIDIALDPFPYGGGTTTCDALWMGVPVVCLAGQMAVGRGGVSILSNLGLTEILGQDTQQYVRIAVDLAGDQARLELLRGTLRGLMKKSPLMDAPRFARNIEQAYRGMWQSWCAGRAERR